MYYYDIHVFFSRNEGYSFGITSLVDLGEDDAIAEAIKQGKFSDESDANHVDIVDELSAKEYQQIYGDC